jgi:hypothetical protein
MTHNNAQREQNDMTYEIIETSGIGPNLRKTVVATADSLADAIALARSMFNVIDLEIDALNPRCADFYTACNRVMQIEPWA